MTISTGTEKTFDKMQHPFLIKSSKQKSRNRRKFPQPDKEHLQKTYC